MLSKENFKINEKVEDLKIYRYDDQNNEYIRKVNGTIYQITDNFIVIDNGKFKESFQYSELCPSENNEVIEPYDTSLETYEDNIVEECLEDVNNGKKGKLFTIEQLNKFMALTKSQNYHIMSEDSIIYIEKIL